MKKKLSLILAAVMTISVAMAGCGGEKKSDTPAPADGETAATVEKANLKMSVTTSESSTWTMGAKKFAELVKEKTDGNIEVNVFPNEQLSGGNQAKGIEMLSSGVIDISLHSNIIYSVMDERLGVISLPWLLPDTETADAKLGGEAGAAVADIAREKGIEVLAFGENGFRELTNNVKAIHTPDDMKGLKVRIPGIKMYTELFKSLGADPITMNFSEVFTALQQNTIDGQENPTDVIKSSKLEEVQKYITIWGYSYDALLLGINEDKFNEFSPETQEILRDCAQEAMEYQRQLNRDKVGEQIAYFEENAIEVNTLTPDEIKLFQESVQPVYDTYTDIIGEDIINLFK